MIINVRGTFGAGKSTLIRRVMTELCAFGGRSKILEAGRKQPIGYSTLIGLVPLTVLGHYETECGGCDTINGMDRIYNLVRRYADIGHHVLFEGALVTSDVNRTVKLHEDGYQLLVVGLNLPLQECWASVNARRCAKDPTKEDVKINNIRSKHRSNELCMARLIAAGVNAVWADREQAFQIIKIVL